MSEVGYGWSGGEYGPIDTPDDVDLYASILTNADWRTNELEIQSTFLRPEWIAGMPVWFVEDLNRYAWPRVWTITIIRIDDGKTPHAYYDGDLSVWTVLQLIALPNLGFTFEVMQ